jgi:hypothetical protein
MRDERPAEPGVRRCEFVRKNTKGTATESPKTFAGEQENGVTAGARGPSISVTNERAGIDHGRA